MGAYSNEFSEPKSNLKKKKSCKTMKSEVLAHS